MEVVFSIEKHVGLKALGKPHGGLEVWQGADVLAIRAILVSQNDDHVLDVRILLEASDKCEQALLDRVVIAVLLERGHLRWEVVPGLSVSIRRPLLDHAQDLRQDRPSQSGFLRWHPQSPR